MTKDSTSTHWRERLKQKNQEDFQQLKELLDESNAETQTLLQKHSNDLRKSLSDEKRSIDGILKDFKSQVQQGVESTQKVQSTAEKRFKQASTQGMKETHQAILSQHSLLLRKMRVGLWSALLSLLVLIIAMSLLAGAGWIYMQQQKLLSQLDPIEAYPSRDGGMILIMPGNPVIQKADDGRTIIELKE